MTLREKQSLFAEHVARLIQFAISRGYQVTLGEAWRSEHEAKRHQAEGSSHVKRSLHQDRLAIDLNLFLEGAWLTTTEAHRWLGEWWEAQSTPELQFTWGGHFGDGNHYSLSHEGRR